MPRSKHSIASTKAHEDMAARGQHTTEKSTPAEKTLVKAVENVKKILETQGHTVELIFNPSYYDMKQNAHVHLGTPAPTEDDKMVTICPDGGVLIVNGKIAGIFEHKYEGTADDKGNEDKKWTAGSTIDRTFKNVNACKMYCAGTGVFPYVVFAHGCNFHPRLKLPKRLEQGNYGFPPHVIIITPEDDGKEAFVRLLDTITQDTVRPRGPFKLDVASIFIKTHAARNEEPPHETVADLKEECKRLGLITTGSRKDLLDRLPTRPVYEVPNVKMSNGASDWTLEEYEQIIMKVVKSVI